MRYAPFTLRPKFCRTATYVARSFHEDVGSRCHGRGPGAGLAVVGGGGRGAAPEEAADEVDDETADEKAFEHRPAGLRGGWRRRGIVVVHLKRFKKFNFFEKKLNFFKIFVTKILKNLIFETKTYANI